MYFLHQHHHGGRLVDLNCNFFSSAIRNSQIAAECHHPPIPSVNGELEDGEIPSLDGNSCNPSSNKNEDVDDK
jgi:hypothetical protein